VLAPITDVLAIIKEDFLQDAKEIDFRKKPQSEMLRLLSIIAKVMAIL
jgi:hypothetical protein